MDQGLQSRKTDLVTFRLTGAAGVELINKDGRTLLVDPYYSRCGAGEVVFRPLTAKVHEVRRQVERIGEIAGIVVSHSHFDHALDIPEFSKYTDGPVIGSSSLENLMDRCGQGGRATVCSGGEVMDLPGNIRITMLPSIHGRVALGRIPFPGEIETNRPRAMKAKDYKVGQVFSPKIEMGGSVFLHVGSAGYVDSALAGQRCDVVFLCVPGWKRTPGYPERIIELTGAKTVVLFHQDHFFRPFEQGKKMKTLPFSDVKGLVRTIRRYAPDVAVLVPDLFETLDHRGRACHGPDGLA